MRGHENGDSTGIKEYRLSIWAVMDQEQDKNNVRCKATLETLPAGNRAGNTVLYDKIVDWANTRQGALLQGFIDLVGATDPGSRLTVVNPYNSVGIRTICLENHEQSTQKLYKDVFDLLNERACRVVQEPGGPTEDRSFGLRWGESSGTELQAELHRLQTQRGELVAESEKLREELAAQVAEAERLREELATKGQSQRLQTGTPVSPSLQVLSSADQAAPTLYADVTKRADGAVDACFTSIPDWDWNRDGLKDWRNILRDALFYEIIVKENTFDNASYDMPAFALCKACEQIANQFLAKPLLGNLWKDREARKVLENYLHAQPFPRDTNRTLSLRDIQLILFDRNPDSPRPLDHRPTELVLRVYSFVGKPASRKWLTGAETKQRLGKVNETRNRCAHESEHVTQREYQDLRAILLEGDGALIPRLLAL